MPAPFWRSDFVSDFLAYTAETMSPDIFRKWAGIGVLAGALERRVWIRTGGNFGETFPNLYMLFVAPPGVGKGVIDVVSDLWNATCEPGTKVPVFSVAPDSVTKASLVDNLAKAKNKSLLLDGPNGLVYHSLLVAAEELGVLLPDYDTEFIAVLNFLYGNKPGFRETRRHGPARDTNIEFPQLNIIGGAQPQWLASSFPEEAWGMGFASRLLMIYSSETPYVELFRDTIPRDDLRMNLLDSLGRVSQMYGQMQWTQEAVEEIRAWAKAGAPPTPSHSKLEHYNRRRIQHVLKLTMVATISRTGTKLIEQQDFERARMWLLEAEETMPDIFRAMVGKSDQQVLEELWLFATATYTRPGPQRAKPIPESKLWEFLSVRVPSDKIERLIMVAEKSDMVAAVAGSISPRLYVPRPRTDFSPE